MKIFVFSAHSLWTPHYATELEIIERHISNGDEVFHFTCYGDLKACDLNIKHSFQVCLHCADQTNCGRRLLTGNVPSLPLIKLDRNEKNKIKEFVKNLNYNSIEEVQQLQYKSFDVGYAATASLISFFRDSKPRIKTYAEEIVNLMISGIEVYESTLKYITRYKPDRIYAFNGRFAPMKAILRASQLANIECYIHERGADMNKYDLWRNTTPHDIKYMVNSINDYWDKADSQIKTSIGESFYTERFGGVEQGWYSFTKHQEKILPDDWDQQKKNIVIFNSSEDEFTSIGPEWNYPIYEDQLSGIKKIVEDLSAEKNIKIYLRVHPNLRGVDDESTRAISRLHYENLTIVPADSRVSSYELLFNANCVITFGSTMGIEAVYWRIPSISLHKSFYYDMEATYNPKSHEELIILLKSDLKPIGYEQSLKFGYFYKTFGLSYNIYKPTSLRNGSFKSIDFEKQTTKAREIILKALYIRFIGRPLRMLEKLYQKKKWRLSFLR